MACFIPVRDALAAVAWAAALIVVQPAKAADGSPSYGPDVMANMATEAAQCIAYFTISAQAMRDADRPGVAARYDIAADRAFDWAMLLAQWAGLKPEAVEATGRLEVEAQMGRIDGNMANISILVADYGHLCKTVLESPEERAVYWIDRLTER